MSATPCKFFLRGACKFGSHCRFYHAPQTNQPFGGPPSGFFGGNQQQNMGNIYGQSQESRQKVNENLKNVADLVRDDMTQWEGCNIWPLSCYGPVAGKGNLEGFQDVSPEELRWETMKNNGTPPNNLAMAVMQLRGNRAKWQQTTDAANLATLESLVLGSNQRPMAPSSNSLFQTTPAATNVFGGAPQTSTQPSIFGGNAFGSSFSNAQPSFNQNPAASQGFGIQNPLPISVQTLPNNSMQPQGNTSLGGGFSFNTTLIQQPVQGGMTQNPGFASLAPNMQPNQTVQMNSSFGAIQTQPSTVPSGLFSTPFGQTATMNPAQPPSGLFGGLNSGSQNTPFGAPPSYSASTFPTNPAPQSLFGQPQLASNMNPTSGFSTTAAPSFQTNMPSMLQPSAPSDYDKYIYSDLSELSPAEIQAFESASFDENSLPLKAPARNFCV